jgi:hypothetical protein
MAFNRVVYIERALQYIHLPAAMFSNHHSPFFQSIGETLDKETGYCTKWHAVELFIVYRTRAPKSSTVSIPQLGRINSQTTEFVASCSQGSRKLSPIKESQKIGKKNMPQSKIDRVPTLQANNTPFSPVTPCSVPLA